MVTVRPLACWIQKKLNKTAGECHYATFGLSYTIKLTKRTLVMVTTPLLACRIQKNLPWPLVMVTTPLLAFRIQKKLTKAAGDGHYATFGLSDTKKNLSRPLVTATTPPVACHAQKSLPRPEVMVTT
jgi:hypothetical protein